LQDLQQHRLLSATNNLLIFISDILYLPRYEAREMFYQILYYLFIFLPIEFIYIIVRECFVIYEGLSIHNE